MDLVATGRHLAVFVVEPLRRLLVPPAFWSDPDAGADADGAIAGGVDSIDSVTTSINAAEVPFCQEFLLMGGRQPVDLPETWSETRHAFGVGRVGEGIAPEK